MPRPSPHVVKMPRRLKKSSKRRRLTPAYTFAVDTLEYLKKGGRSLPAAADHRHGTQVKTGPHNQGDKLDSFAKTRGMKSAFKTMVEAVRHDIASRFSHLEERKILKVGIANTMMDEEKLEGFEEELQNNFPDKELFYLPLLAP